MTFVGSLIGNTGSDFVRHPADHPASPASVSQIMAEYRQWTVHHLVVFLLTFFRYENSLYTLTDTQIREVINRLEIFGLLYDRSW